MNITYLIGNGFDINLGLNTRYTDVYKEYVKEKSPSTVIEKFKNDLKEDEMNSFENWSDFEWGMAQYSVNFDSSNDFILCLRDFKKFLSKYLSDENERFNSLSNFNEYVQVFLDSINSYAKGYVENVYEYLTSYEYKTFNFINFNYTYSLDNLVKECKTDNNSIYKNKYNAPVHIHGKCGGDIALGIDNPEQISNMKFRTDKRVMRAFVKPKYNDTINRSRVSAAKEIIKKSNVICAFGMSFGVSDKIWIEEIKNWLGESDYNHFIFYCYPTLHCSEVNPDEGLELEEDEKEKLKTIFGFSDNEWDLIERKIHIPVNFKAFDFASITSKPTLATIF